MERQRPAVVSILSTALILSSCRESTEERVFLRQDVSKQLQERSTPYKGIYRLYAGIVIKGQLPTSKSAIVEKFLAKDQRIGFARDSLGQLLAVYGDDQQAITGGHFTWTMQPDDGQVDAGKTLLLVGVLVLVAAGIAVAVYAIRVNNDLEDAFGGLRFPSI